MAAVTSQQGQQSARPSIQGLSADSRKLTQGELIIRLQAILSTIGVFGLPQNRVHVYVSIARQPLTFKEAGTAELESRFGPKAGHSRRTRAPSDSRWPKPSSG